MAGKDEEKIRAIQEAVRRVEEAREIPLTVPLSVAFDVGAVVAFGRIWKNTRGMPVIAESYVLSKLDAVIPRELLELGLEGFGGDINQEVPMRLSFSEIDLCGEDALLIPKAEEIGALLDARRADKDLYDSRRQSWMHSFLNLQRSFAAAGGRLDKGLREKVEERLR